LLQLLVNKKLATLTTSEKLMAFHARHIMLKALTWPNGTYEFKSAQTVGNLVAKIRYDCRQLVRDFTSETERSTAVENTSTDGSSQITGPSLKNAILQKMKDLPPNLLTVVKAKKMLATENFDFEALKIRSWKKFPPREKLNRSMSKGALPKAAGLNWLEAG